MARGCPRGRSPRTPSRRAVGGGTTPSSTRPGSHPGPIAWSRPDRGWNLAKGWSRLGESPVWGWLRGRLDVIWGAFAQALQRLALLLAWWPFLALLLVAALGDGWLRRRIRQYGFVYASPLAHHTALWVLLTLWIGVGLLLFAPIPIPALAIPVIGVITAVCVDLVLTNAQKRL